MYFLRQLKKLNLPRTMTVNFYTSIVESIIIWYTADTEKDKSRLQRIIHSAERVIGCNLPSLQDLYASRTLRRARKIVADSSHPGHKLFETLPAGGCGPSGPKPLATKTASSRLLSALSTRLDCHWFPRSPIAPTTSTNSLYVETYLVIKTDSDSDSDSDCVIFVKLFSFWSLRAWNNKFRGQSTENVSVWVNYWSEITLVWFLWSFSVSEVCRPEIVILEHSQLKMTQCEWILVKITTCVMFVKLFSFWVCRPETGIFKDSQLKTTQCECILVRINTCVIFVKLFSFWGLQAWNNNFQI